MTSKEALDELEWFINCVYDSVEDGHAAYLKDEVESASNAYDKLEKDLEVLEEYKSIEEELGIDLITLFKALKDGFYHIDKDKHIYKTKRTKGNGGAMSYYASYYEIIAEDAFGDQYFYKLKDYGKVWGLTKEELEQNGK